MDLTKGNVTKLILRFALPIMLGDLFQQLYISADTAIIGRYAGDSALVAVGSTTFLIRFVIGLFVGISTGASVVLAHCVGARDDERSARTVHTMAALTLIGGVLLSVGGVLGAQGLLCMVDTPQDVLAQATIYLQIYLGGAIFDLIYNVGSGILNAYGNSRRAFFYLMSSSVTNIILDIALIKRIPLGVAGAAIATVASQALAAALVVADMLRTKESYHLYVRNIRLEASLASEILKMGLPAGFQRVIVSLSNVVVQLNVNHYGSAVVGGFSIFNKVDGILMLPCMSLAAAVMSFTGQNFGARKHERIVKGIKVTFWLEMVGWALGSLVCLFFGREILSIFSDDEEILHYGLMTMYYMIPSYWTLGVGNAYVSIIHGMGKSRTASVISILNMCVARQIWIVIANAFGMGLKGILLSYPISWILTLAGAVLYGLYLKKTGGIDEDKHKRADLLCV
ncbi:MAG: MATE family efflux transporter [bacterium]|nr:MATE family efflux transporter [bacterium]